MTSVGVMSFREVPEYFYFIEINIFYLRCFFNHSRAKELSRESIQQKSLLTLHLAFPQSLEGTDRMCTQ